MRIQTGLLVSLGYGRYVRSDDIAAIEPITEDRGPGRRCMVWVRGVADPIVASRSEGAIIADMTSPAEQGRANVTFAGRTPGRTTRAVAARSRAGAGRRAAAKRPSRR